MRQLLWTHVYIPNYTGVPVQVQVFPQNVYRYTTCPNTGTVCVSAEPSM